MRQKKTVYTLLVLALLGPMTTTVFAATQVAGGGYHTVGLKTDGTVVAVGNNFYGQCNVSSWTDIIQVATGGGHTVGLKIDGTVVAVGDSNEGQCNVNSWTDITQIAAGASYTVGLKSNGTVVAVGDNYFGQCNVGAWNGIAHIAAGNSHTLGLKTNGRVVAMGYNYAGQCNVSGWSGIIQLAAGNYHSIGLKTDGTAVAAGNNYYGECNVGSWSGLEQVAAGNYHTVGLKTDGTAVAAGQNEKGQCNVSAWSNIVQVAAGSKHTVGVKTDGAAIAVGYNEDGQCNVGDWRLGDDASTPEMPGTALLISPDSSSSAGNPVTYTWDAVSNATWYYLWVNDSSGNQVSQWYTAAECDCQSGAGNCTVTPSATLAAGDCTWWVKTWNENGLGSWSDGLNFTIEGSATLPSAATLIHPDTAEKSNPVTYTWEAVPAASWYYLWVDDSTGNMIKKWYTAAECGCESGTGECSVTPEVYLNAGSVEWWIQTWNSYGYGDWSSSLTFTVDSEGAGPPSAAILDSPDSSTTVSNPVTFTWNAVPGASWYYLWVEDTTGRKIKIWYTAALCDCESGTGHCSVTPDVSFSGWCSWWIQTWNSYGYGDWSDELKFEAVD